MKKANIPAKDLEKILKKFGQTKNVNKLKNSYKDLNKDLTDLEKK
jgi:arsenate reductase-like glutaredoxin family protein